MFVFYLNFFILFPLKINMVDLFVYGTLQFPEVVFALTGKSFDSLDAVLKDHKVYQISPPKGQEGMCPAAIPEKGSVVYGKILFDVDNHSMEIIDFFESDDYEKQELEVESREKNYKALVYIWKDFLKDRLKKHWNKEEFEKNYLEDCLKKTIPEILEEYKKSLL